jgi:hypothetical protein
MMGPDAKRDGPPVEVLQEGKTKISAQALGDEEKPSNINNDNNFSGSNATPDVTMTNQKNTSVKEKKVKPEKREKRPYHYRTKKPRDMPKRPLSAYNYFFRTERGKIIADQAEKEADGTTGTGTTPEAAPEAQAREEGGEKKKASLFSTMGKTIAKRWKEIDPEELKEYKALAEEDSKRYRYEMDEYHMGRAKKGPPRKEEKDSPVSSEAPSTQPAAPSFLEGMNGLSSSSPGWGGPSAAQLQQQQQPPQTAFGIDPYLDQLFRLQQAQQGSLPPPQQQQHYEFPASGGGGATAGGAVDMSALQSQILDAQLSRAMQQQQQQQQRASLGLDLYSSAAGGQYAVAMARQGLYGDPHQAMMDGALFQRASQGMQPPAQAPASQQQQSQQQGITQGGGGGYDSLFSSFLEGNNARAAAVSGAEQQQLLLQQLMQQQQGSSLGMPPQFAAAQQHPQQYSALSMRDPPASPGDMAQLLMLQQHQQAMGSYPGEEKDAPGGDSAGERYDGGHWRY